MVVKTFLLVLHCFKDFVVCSLSAFACTQKSATCASPTRQESPPSLRIFSPLSSCRAFYEVLAYILTQLLFWDSYFQRSAQAGHILLRVQKYAKIHLN